MRITDALWTPEVNYLEVQCDRCEAFVVHRADRWMVCCAECGARESLLTIRERYVNDARDDSGSGDGGDVVG